jgi:hypothetical protein
MYPDGSVEELGTTTTNINGNFGYMWKPQSTGQYTIIASFEGSESYWPSSQSTHVGVDAAPSASITPQPTTTTEPTTTPPVTEPPVESPSPSTPTGPEEGPATEMYIIAAVAVIIIIAAAAAAIILRRRK